MRILIRCQEPKTARDAMDRLAAAGFEARAMPGPPEAFRPAPDGQDVVIIPAAACDDPAAQALAETAWRFEPKPLAVMAALPYAAPPAPGLKPAANFDATLALDSAPRALGRQMKDAIRAAVTREEAARRRASAEALGMVPPDALAPGRLKALYIGGPSRMFLALEDAFTRYGGSLRAAFSSYAGFDHLHDDMFDAVLINGARDPGTALSLCAALRRNARLHHMPTLLIAPPDDDTVAEAAIERGAAAVVSANDEETPSLGWLFEAIRTTRRRVRDEHDLRDLRDLLGDPRTGLFRRKPFEAHIGRIADEHHQSGRPMSVAVLRVLPAHGARRPSEETWRKGFAEIATLAGRLVRDSDSAAAFGQDRIIIALPGAPLHAAKRAAERVASVAECTAFASGDDAAGPLVFEQYATELNAGESGAALLARALGAFEEEASLA